MKRKRQNRRKSSARRRHAAAISAGLASPQAASLPTRWAHRLARQSRQAVARWARRLASPQVWLLAAVHLAVFVAVYWLGFFVRFEFDVPYREIVRFRMTLGWVLAVKFVLFLSFGHYDGWWAYVTFADLIALVRTSMLALFAMATLQYFLGEAYFTPRSILIMDCVGTIMVLGALRGSWRLYREQFWPIFQPGGQRFALLVGTDRSTGLLAHQIQSYGELPYRIRGLLATDDKETGSRLGQVPILGRLDDLREIAVACKATDVLVTAGTLPGSQLRGLMDACQENGLTLKIIRRLEDRLSGDHRIPVRDIEISDLLRRAPVQLDTKMIGKLLQGRIVMVTGAGGSIGSEICRQVLRFNPKTLVLVGRGENRIFRIERRLQTLHTDTTLCSCIADITDSARMRDIFVQHRPEVVFHAAAHKHVPLMETNVGEAVKNNICGTRRLADMADEFGVRNFVFISTDKAVHPTSVMGVSKQIAERYVHAMSQASATRFTVVRFGNVLGSDGSVVPIFQEQIRRGGPITVTDPRMTRFFMTIPEASQLVLQAAAMGRGGEIFVLEMGEPVKIVDLARDLIRLSGLPDDSIEICFTGIRPGEKLYEELYFEGEETLPTSHPKLRAAKHRPFRLADVRDAISSLEDLIHAPCDAVRRRLREVVIEYSPPSSADGSTDPIKDGPPAVLHDVKLHL